MVKPIMHADKKSLRQKSKSVVKVDKKVKSLIKDLKETLAAQTDPEGVGLAAPQIGRNFRAFVMQAGSELKTVINPKVLEVSKEKIKKPSKSSPLEGCLSIPHFYGPLTRASKIKLEYLNEKGETVTETFTGFDAQIVQHEIDHLEGILFVDRILEEGLPLYELKDGEWIRAEL